MLPIIVGIAVGDGGIPSDDSVKEHNEMVKNMSNENEYEVISYSNSYYNIFLNEIMYRTPHIHKDFEICLLLEGTIKIKVEDEILTAKKNDLWIINSYEPHEFKAIDKKALILIIQISPFFFSPFFKAADVIRFSHEPVQCTSTENPLLFCTMLNIGKDFFWKCKNYELKCAYKLLYLFNSLIGVIPNVQVDEFEQKRYRGEKELLRKIIACIDENYYQKLLLADIAEKTNFSVNYLSHYFKNMVGMSFQKYLAKVRCDRASILLVTTKLSIFDISIACGFSDIKYLKNKFKEFYGIYPQEYRHESKIVIDNSDISSGITTEMRLNSEACKEIVNLYFYKVTENLYVSDD